MSKQISKNERDVSVWWPPGCIMHRPGQTLKVPGGWGTVVKFSILSTGRLHPWHSCLLDAEWTPGPEELCQWKIQMTPSEIEPATFLRLAQCLKQLNRHVPPYCYSFHLYSVLKDAESSRLMISRRFEQYASNIIAVKIQRLRRWAFRVKHYMLCSW